MQARRTPQFTFALFLKTTFRQSLMLLLSVGLVLGAVLAGYLLALPSDPEAHFVGRYSLNRLLLFGGPLLLSLGCGGLLVKTVQDRTWGEIAGKKLLGDQRALARWVASCIGVGGTVFMAVLFLRPAWVLELNELRFQRLLPYVVMPLALLGGLWMVRRLATSGFQPAITSLGLDVLCGAALFVGAFAARYPLTGFALPYAGIWDEVVTYAPALARVGGDELVVDKDISVWGRAGYGELLIDVTTVAEVAGLLDGMRSQRVFSLEDFVSPTPGVATIWEGVHPSGIPLQYPRTVFALLNSLGPALVFLGLRRHLGAGRAPALVGGLLLAVGSRDILFFSSFILPDALAMTLSIGIVLCSLEVMRDPKGALQWYVLAGILTGLASATVLRYLVLAAIPLAAFLLAPNRSRVLPKLGLLAAGAVVGFFLSSPGFLTDLPRQLFRLAGNDWEHNLSVANRAESVVFYLRGMFDPDFEQYWFRLPQGETGLGVLTLAVALVGATRLASSKPKVAALLFGVFAAYLWWLSPIQSNATRHALVLYPLACMLAACGIEAVAEALRRLSVAVGRTRKPRGQTPTAGLARSVWVPWAVAGLFVVSSAGRIGRSVDFVIEMATFKTSQQRMGEFLQREMGPGEKVGILDIVPFDTADLFRRGLRYERVAASDSLADLQRRGIHIVVGSDLTSNEYPSISDTIWDVAFDGPTVRIAEFGDQELVYRGEPKPSVYIFAARIPAGSGGKVTPP